MKNDDFRKLVFDAPGSQADVSQAGRGSTLGTKRASFAPMTPRPGHAPSSTDFARQVREQHASLRPAKRFKSSAPKGSKFAAGYTDRAKERQEGRGEDEQADKARRIQALEEQVKLGQLERDTFETLRDEIVGGEIANTHLVKGLDRRLLERVRRGEDVLRLNGDKSGGSVPHVDEELSDLERKEVETITREKTEKRGTKAPSQMPAVKRTRDEIMAELKAQRRAAAEAKAAAAPSFDNRWRRVGGKIRPQIEVDRKGREVLITRGADGTVKKKVRKPAVEMPDPSKPVLGADVVVPEAAKSTLGEDEEDEDIFADAGTDYNPLGEDNGEEEADSGDSDESGEEEEEEDKDAIKEQKMKAKAMEGEDSQVRSESPSKSTQAEKPATRRNYFTNQAETVEDNAQERFRGIEKVLKKAGQMERLPGEADEGSASEETRAKRLAKRAQMLQPDDRDFADMDMGFGSSRFEDAADAIDPQPTRLSEWPSRSRGETDPLGDNEAAEDKTRNRNHHGHNSGPRKPRKPKKRSGDVNSAADVLRIIDRRKG